MGLVSNRSGALAALAAAVSLSGCANFTFDSNERWFSKPLDVFGRTGGYTYSELQESRELRPIGENDLVDANGGCPPSPPPQSTPGNPGQNAAVAPDAAGLASGGIALGMSECDVVHRAGQPSAVQLGNGPNGDRTAVLSFKDGPRAGVYHFERGRLMQMDRAEQPPPPPPTAKKKPAKHKKPPNGNAA